MAKDKKTQKQPPVDPADRPTPSKAAEKRISEKGSEGKSGGLGQASNLEDEVNN